MAAEDDKLHGGKFSFQENNLRDIILQQVNSYPVNSPKYWRRTDKPRSLYLQRLEESHARRGNTRYLEIGLDPGPQEEFDAVAQRRQTQSGYHRLRKDQ